MMTLITATKETISPPFVNVFFFQMNIVKELATCKARK